MHYPLIDLKHSVLYVKYILIRPLRVNKPVGEAVMFQTFLPNALSERTAIPAKHGTDGQQDPDVQGARGCLH